MTEQAELLPCPFCGSVANHASRANDNNTGWQNGVDHWIYCSGENCVADMGMGETQAEVVSMWNRRAAVQPTPQEADYDDIPDTPEQRALIKHHNEEMRRKYPNLKSIYPTSTGVVEVCPLCDIAGCRHIRERKSAADKITPQQAAKVLLDQPYSVMTKAFDAMDRLQGEGADNVMAAALRAIASEDNQ